jgi:organic hydroperoxide reductase OsmC/OhrA
MREPRQHSYAVRVTWTGNLGEGTSHYRAYARDHEIANPGRAPICGSSDPVFRGDPARYSPEELLIGALSACHMLWYLHLCANAGVSVVAYEDVPTGRMEEGLDGGGRFTGVALAPTVRIARGGDPELAHRLHRRAHELCFLARSVDFPVEYRPVVVLESGESETAIPPNPQYPSSAEHIHPNQTRP